jgi:SGNH domain (fused to AT3 domains)
VQLISDRGFKLAIVSPPPSNGEIIKCIKLADRSNSSFDMCRYPRDDIQERQKRVFGILSRISDEAGVPLVDLRLALCDAVYCQVTAGGTLLYRDNGHLSNGSTPFIADYLSRALTDALAPATL